LLLGVNGVAMKAHGNSDAYSFESALKVVKSLASFKLPEKIKEGIENA
jgi:fatty acid/phospholipid biosynthesis enzyme